MLNIYKAGKKAHPRLTNNIILSVISLLGCLVTLMLASPTMPVLEALAVGTGYIGLGLLALTLLIGPLNMIKVRKNPVNLNFRRDAGIWAGIVSLAHVVLAFALEINWGGTLLGYFLYKDGSLKLNLFGVSNYIGLFATLVLIFLLVLSNNRFLKSLKGKKWKFFQRFNYLLFALVLGHTFTQQVNNVRGLWMIAGAVLVTVSVMIGQAIGFKIYRKRELERKTAPLAKPVSARGSVATQAAPVRSIPVASGFTKLKIASAVALMAMLGIGAGLEGLSLLNEQVTAQTGSLASDETTATDTSSPAAVTAAETTTAAATTAATTIVTTTATTPAVSTTAAATTAAATTTTAATTAATTTAAASTTFAPTTAAATTAAAATTTKAATTTTVSKSSTSSGSTHTGGS